MFGSIPRVAAETSLSFVAPVAIDDGLASRLALGRRLVPVRDTRSLGKQHMPENDVLPRIEVDPDTFTVCIDGEAVDEAPVATLPMAQRYFLF